MNLKNAAASAAALILTALAVSGQQEPIRSQAELRRSLASAKTTADHARIAAYYRQLARSYAQKQAEEEEIAAKLQKQYENWTKTPNPYQSAKNLAAYYAGRAKDSLTHAVQQDKLAAR